MTSWRSPSASSTGTGRGWRPAPASTRTCGGSCCVRGWTRSGGPGGAGRSRTQQLPELEADAPVPIDDREQLLDLLNGQRTSRRRAAVVLRFDRDLSIDETAEILDCTAGTVKSQTARGLDTLREAAARD